MPFAVFANCPSSKLREGLLPEFTCILALSATYFGSFTRRALVRSRTPMIWCLSNARSWDLHFGTSLVALRALVREIITNTIHTYIHTWPNSDFHRLFDSGFAPSALSLRLNERKLLFFLNKVTSSNCPKQIWICLTNRFLKLSYADTYVCKELAGSFQHSRPTCCLHK